MNLTTAMTAFVRVVETGSFSAVAKEQGTLQPAISKQIAWLEAHLGNRLIERTTRRLVFTDEALQYYERSKAILEAISDAETIVKQGRADVAGEIRIAASVGFGSFQLVPLLAGFLRKYPAITIDLRLSDTFIDVVAEGVDVSFRIGQVSDPNVIAKRIGMVRPIVLASSKYLANHGRPKNIDDLASHQSVIISGRRDAEHWRFESPLGPINAKIHSRVRTDSGIGARALVLAGIGIGFLPQWLFKDELKSGAVKRLLSAYPTCGPNLSAITPVSRRYSARVKALLEYLGEHFGREGSIDTRQIK
jgi:DNA-binding transcriptional LysR family regulator